ncbi:MAG: hypothetical protein WA080_08000 [Sulfuricurvum sp.]
MQKTSCILKLAISYTLKNLIEKLVNDINTWKETSFSEEELVLTQLEEILQDRDICDDRCMGCLDYRLVNNIFINFSDKIIDTNKLYEELIMYILNTLELNQLKDSIEIAINLISNPKYIKEHIDENRRNEYNKYVSEINDIVIALKLAFYNQKIIELDDVVLNYAKLSQEQQIAQKLAIVNEACTTFYIDQNFIGKYINDDNLKRQINNIKEKAKYQFVFSPYMIEDGIKMNKAFLKEYFEHIDSLTNGILVARYNDKLCYVHEEINSIVDRVLLWQQPTEAGENLKYYWSLYNQNAYPYFKRDGKNPLYQKINDDLKSFLENIDIQPMHSDKKTMEKSLYGYMMLKSYPFDLNDLQKGSIKIDNDFDCIDKIDKLCQFLDFINYQTDKEEQKIKSSYQDIEHLKHAWKCQYFITDDKKLIKRGEFIYSLLKTDLTQ